MQGIFPIGQTSCSKSNSISCMSKYAANARDSGSEYSPYNFNLFGFDYWIIGY